MFNQLQNFCKQFGLPEKQTLKNFKKTLKKPTKGSTVPKKSLQNSIVSLQSNTIGLPVDRSKNNKFLDFFSEINPRNEKNFIIF